MALENALPGQAWPPPVISYHSTSAPSGQEYTRWSMVTTSSPGTAVSVGVGSHPLRAAHPAVATGAVAKGTQLSAVPWKVMAGTARSAAQPAGVRIPATGAAAATRALSGPHMSVLVSMAP